PIPPAQPGPDQGPPPPRKGERRLPMALAVLAAGGLRAVLPDQLRAGDARWMLPLVMVVLLTVLIIGDPGRIDRDSPALRALTGPLFGGPGWYPKFVDYMHLSFTTAAAFSPTDVSAIRTWAKLLMMAEQAMSMVVALLVVARAVNILR